MIGVVFSKMIFWYFESPKIARNSGGNGGTGGTGSASWLGTQHLYLKFGFIERNTRAQKSALPAKFSTNIWHKMNSDIPLWKCQLIGPDRLDLVHFIYSHKFSTCYFFKLVIFKKNKELRWLKVKLT